jgi:hypothetical protein
MWALWIEAFEAKPAEVSFEREACQDHRLLEGAKVGTSAVHPRLSKYIEQSDSALRLASVTLNELKP